MAKIEKYHKSKPKHTQLARYVPWHGRHSSTYLHKDVVFDFTTYEKYVFEEKIANASKQCGCGLGLALSRIIFQSFTSMLSTDDILHKIPENSQSRSGRRRSSNKVRNNNVQRKCCHCFCVVFCVFCFMRYVFFPSPSSSRELIVLTFLLRCSC